MEYRGTNRSTTSFLLIIARGTFIFIATERGAKLIATKIYVNVFPKVENG